MGASGTGRTILAVVSGYLVNGILVAVTEQLLSWRRAALQPLGYFAVDLTSQCFYTILGGYLCCAIAGPTQRRAMAGLIGLGLLVGTVSLVSSWATEPHWYGIALLTVYPPCVWIGWMVRLMVGTNDRL